MLYVDERFKYFLPDRKKLPRCRRCRRRRRRRRRRRHQLCQQASFIFIS